MCMCGCMSLAEIVASKPGCCPDPPIFLFVSFFFYPFIFLCCLNLFLALSFHFFPFYFSPFPFLFFSFNFPFLSLPSSFLLSYCVLGVFSLPDCLPACQGADKHFPWICHSHLASIWVFFNEVIGSGGKH